MPHTRVGRLVAAAALALTLGACGGADPSSPGPSVTPAQSAGTDAGPSPASARASAPAGSTVRADAADVAFAQMMIPHHQQAVQISDLVLAKAGLNPQVETLAEQTRDAQAPEISTMTRWLQEWGAPSTGGMGGTDHGALGGMLSAGQIRDLGDADTAEAQRLYVRGMIGHHQGAVAMAQTEIESGSDPDAVALARLIVAMQTVEIDTMTTLLPTL